MGAVVLDASAVFEVLTAGAPETPFDSFFQPGVDVHVPASCDVEVVSALGHAMRKGLLDDSAARTALLEYVSLPIERHLMLRLIGRAYELRRNFATSDAMYVALAESLDAELVTADLRLKRAARRHTSLRVLP